MWLGNIGPAARAAAVFLSVAMGAAVAPMASALADNLTIGVRTGPETIDPAYSFVGTHIEAVKHVFDPLVWLDERLQLKPWLAESWERIDELTWEFKIRKGVKFHDGSELTAEDVKFSIERLPVATGPQSAASVVKNVAATTIVDDHTLRITTPVPTGILPYDFYRLFIVSHKIGMEARAEQFNEGTAAIGTGPYRYVSWSPKGDLVLDRFDDYWGGKGAWERVIRREISNDATRLAALLGGEVDLVNYVSNADFATLSQNPDFQLIKGDSNYMFWLWLDLRPEPHFVTDLAGNPLPENPLLDPRVREAIDLAIDRRAIVDNVLEGIGKAGGSIADFSYFRDTGNIRPHDPARARTLLAEAGLADGFRLGIHCTNDRYPGDSQVCAAIAQMLSTVGIVTEAHILPRAVMIPGWASGEWGSTIMAWAVLNGEAYITLSLVFHTNDAEKKVGGFNRWGYSNPEVDRLTAEAESEADPAKRMAIVESALNMADADRFTIPISVIQTIWAARKGLELSPRLDEETLAHFVKPAAE